MAFSDPLQWIIVGIIAILIFLWGPSKIPELARALGRAKKEFEEASKEFTSTPAPSQTQALQQVQPKTGDQILIETARQLGISTEGKTREQIAQEILNKAKAQ
jgi:sec-independent protein translocase protein TatA